MRTPTGARFKKTAGVALNFIRNGTQQLYIAIPGVEAALALACCLPPGGRLCFARVYLQRPSLKNAPAHGGAGWWNKPARLLRGIQDSAPARRAFNERDDGLLLAVLINQAYGPPVLLFSKRIRLRIAF